MFYVCLVITVFSPLGFAQDAIEECYSSTCMLPNSNSLYDVYGKNCESPIPLPNFWWHRKETYAIELDNNRQMLPYINNSIPFVFLIPGIGESTISPSIDEIIHAYFDYNGTIPTIIEANYSGGRLQSPLYLPPVGECGYLKIADKVTEFLYILNATYNFQIECMHLIGVFFGAHIAGMVGNLLKEKYNYTLGRITGLGPLGEGYNCGACQSLLLNKGDAKFVDIIHTTSGGIDQLGDIDFYVNWPNTDFNFDGNIDHGQLGDTERRDSNYYHDWSSWSQPGCHNASDPDYTYMGLYAKPSRYGAYYVATNSNPPYGMGPPGPTPEGIGPCSCVEIGCRTTISGILTIN